MLWRDEFPAGPAPAASRAPYRGRFAPTPSGPLHFGSLVAALASWLEARAHGGTWLLRIDDVDGPRVAPGATGAILRALEACGLEWDGEPIFQSRRYAAYAEAREALRRQGDTFACTCSRRQIARVARRGAEGPLYPGTCRDGRQAGTREAAHRIRTGAEPLRWRDRLFGPQAVSLAAEVGDFVIWRRDGVCAYHLANVVDDHLDGITEVVRGADLLASTHCQAWLVDRLGLERPGWFHLPVAVRLGGDKLSKQTRAAPLRPEDAGVHLHDALAFLDQAPPAALARAPAAEVLAWARAHWRPAALRPLRHKMAPADAATPPASAGA